MLELVTVRGAGHEVPLFKPRAAFEMFKYFLTGKPLPKACKNSKLRSEIFKELSFCYDYNKLT
ncbi:hypothetical protein DY000_02051740 [Brassica cretica]|uniref:Uncharacterized protein n=1 Tax=Brassica cretica TaxID=69181 RepID=A0ABQ7EV56_BRACR|nr:hypothetical protein DY000_02051740 [Brassica cretica]